MKIKISPGLWNTFDSLEVAYDEFLNLSGLPANIRQKDSVTLENYLLIWQTYSLLVKNLATSILSMSSNFEPTQYPATVAVAYHAPTYRQAIERMSRYSKLCPPVVYEIEESDQEFRIYLSTVDKNHRIPSLLIGSTLTFLFQLGLVGTNKPIKAKKICFVDKVADKQQLAEFFGCDIQDEATQNLLILDQKTINLPFKSYNKELADLLSLTLEDRISELKDTDVKEVLDWYLNRHLSSGELTISKFAKDMGYSERSVQRKLKSKGTSFSNELKLVRQRLVENYLKNKTVNSQEIAFLLGYSDSNAFFRAFKGWYGMTTIEWQNNYT